MKTNNYIARRAYFSCGRELKNPLWSDEENRAVFGRDALPHGHDYTLDVFFSGEMNDHDGMIVNLSDIKPVLHRVLEPLDGAFLNLDSSGSSFPKAWIKRNWRACGCRKARVCGLIKTRIRCD